MKQINIIKNGQTTHSCSALEDEALAWLSRHEGMGTSGQAASSYQQETSPAVLDEAGNEISPAQYETVQVPADYTVEITDITAQLAQQEINAVAKAYLVATDYIVVRSIERGEPLSVEFKAERDAARASIVE